MHDFDQEIILAQWLFYATKVKIIFRRLKVTVILQVPLYFLGAFKVDSLDEYEKLSK